MNHTWYWCIVAAFVYAVAFLGNHFVLRNILVRNILMTPVILLIRSLPMLILLGLEKLGEIAGTWDQVFEQNTPYIARSYKELNDAAKYKRLYDNRFGG